MTQKEFDYYNKTNTMPRFWIGQGWGYKEKDKIWNEIMDDEIIYIPEYGYNDYNEEWETALPLSEGIVDRGSAYSKEDFKQLIRELNKFPEEKVDGYACELWKAVDWQFPATLIEEGWFDEMEG